MALLEILTVPNPLLKRKSEKVEKIDAALRKTLDDMLDTLYEAPGDGIASPPFGLLKRMVVLDVSPESEPQHRSLIELCRCRRTPTCRCCVWRVL